MKKLTLPVTSGMRFDIWLKRSRENSSPLLQFSAGGEIIYAIKKAADYHQYFTYTHYSDQQLTIEWDEDAADISLFYYWLPETLAQEGVTFLISDTHTLYPVGRSKMVDWYSKESLRPALHFSPFINWMNDPNGLCKIDETYHLFYQYYPHSTEWGPMHWGHAASEDLYHWRHYPVFLQPEQNLEALGATGGAFSGTAFQERDGKLRFWFTERLPAYDLYKGYREVQKCATPGPWLDKVESVKQVLSELPAGVGCDFRDPKVWFDCERNHYFMLLGASVDGDPAALLFTSADSDEWTFDHVLWRADSHFREHGGRCVECPDFFSINGKWVLIIGIVGYTEPQTGRHNLLYAQIGDFKKGRFTPDDKPLQTLDFGTDFYALQTFRDGQQILGFAWLYNWASKKSAASVYSGEMSLPRRFMLNNHGALCMQPLLPPEACVRQRTDHHQACQNGLLHLSVDRQQSFSLKLTGKDISRLLLTLNGETGEQAELCYAENWLTLRAEGHDEGQYGAYVEKIETLELFFDAGIVEVFANEGSYCGTRRYFHLSCCNELTLKYNSSAQITTARLTQYRSIWEQ